MPKNVVAIVLAAGKGTRMKSNLPKVLVPVAGRPMLHYVLDALRAAGIDRTIVVVGYRAADVQASCSAYPGVEFVEQTQQLGTGHAVMVCREALQGHTGPVLIVTGDSPMLQPTSVWRLLADYETRGAACLLGTARREDPHGLGRIVRDEQGRFQAIVEEKDATPDQRKIQEVNLSCYLFDCASLLHALDGIRNQNAQREYYLTDCPGVLKAEGRDVEALCVLQPIEALSINTPEELAAVERELLK